ncbi:acyltransferase family protein [Nitratiruptor tergarcus]|uniref:Peptidoglycan/LPS O-acetylase OafA/YrhL, contains acyltransferase and SGNH-hydrolase domains n=1 Tax=Nitratiruptor tergarcus DSM 16512 TaxID=1069081 RepID=A0A1W1WQM4_9BACT|nr:acyltransferase [Nitratiruptor tergarcus]SMC08512.1 Peptidoglycan/LPS O-acetylase OafA/YrhL, contains acyltransferase and SGNH-hydrolase domains [Nitratiruptor tergarcus DSM 16512]
MIFFRGCAVIFVSWLHIAENYKRIASDGLEFYQLFKVFDFGRFGVILFFIISGFLLIGTLRDERHIAVKKYLIKRFFRLYPAFFLSVFIAYPVMKIWGCHFSVKDLLINLTMVPQFFNAPLIQWLYWTLEVQWIFYLLLAVLYYLGYLNNKKVLFSIFLLCVAIFTLSRLLHFHSSHVGLEELPHFLAIMFWAIIVRRFHDNSNEYQRVFYIATIILFTIQIAAVIKYYMTHKMQFIPLMLSFIGAEVFFLIIFFFYHQNIQVKFPVIIHHFIRFIRKVGKISYSMYLFHAIVLHGMYLLIIHHFQDFKNLHLGLYVVVNLSLTIVVGWIMYHLVEKPFNTLGHKLASRVK